MEFCSMGRLPPLPTVDDQDGSSFKALADRVERERVAHQDDRIEKSLSKWWKLFPHVFKNPSTKSMSKFYETQLGDISDRVILECGCGRGDFSAWLYTKGACIAGIDISEFNICRCSVLFEKRDSDPSRYKFFVMDAHHLQFPDQSFDLVVGNGILHHLDTRHAILEINRVLKVGGVALFQEPLSGNPLLSGYRRLAGIHTRDERPLNKADIDFLEKKCGFTARYTGLVTMPVALLTSLFLRPYPNNWFLYLADAAEKSLNSRNVLNSWNRFVILTYRKSAVDA
jgi:SAM-dependent methyltransferase